MVNIAVRILCKTWLDVLGDPEEVATRAAKAALAVDTDHVTENSEVSIVLGDVALVQQLNRDYRNQDEPTNVLAFSGITGDANMHRLMGDVILALEPICEEVEAQGKTFSDHTSHLVVHGTLHLLGFDHDTDQKSKEMEATEISILSALGVPNPYNPTETRLTAELDHG